jgi:diacylglycerol kinase (ATP)
VSTSIIINPISGGRRSRAVGDRVELARRVAAEHGEPIDLHVTEQRGHARMLAETARAQGARVVVAWGGDGTINEVASALAGGDVPLAIVPAGSGNGLARELGIDWHPAAALASAFRATPRPIDVGEIGGRLFVNLAGIGFDAHVAASFDSNRRRGLSAYVWLTGRALLNYAPGTYAIGGSDFRVDVQALLVTIANSPQFGNGVRIAPDARLDDGVLDLVIVEERSRFETVCHLPRFFRGALEGIPVWSSRKITDATIESSEPMRLHVDGEPCDGGTRLDVRVRPGALKICA